jgi:hypothetical protein
LFSLDLMRHVIAIALSAGLFTLSSDAKEQPVISASSEPTGLTVESQKTGKKIIPGIDIYSDGTVAVRRYDGSEATKHIDPEAVRRLAASLARTNFYQVTEDSFDAELARAQKDGVTERVVVTDCPIWGLRTRVGRVTRSTKYYALWEMAEHYPKNQQLKTLKNAILQVYEAVGEKVY